MFGLFALLLVGGMLVSLACGLLVETSDKYVRLVGMLALALSALVTASTLMSEAPPAPPANATAMDERPGSASSSVGHRLILALAAAGGLGAIGVVFGASFISRRTGPVRFSGLVGGSCAIGAAWLTSQAMCAELPDEAVRGFLGSPVGLAALRAGSLLSASLLLGSVTVAWLLGHAYLTATRMTIAPLRRFASILGCAFLLRLLLSALTLGMMVHGAGAAGQPIRAALLGESGMMPLRGVALLVRWLLGLLVPGVFTWMVMDCVRLRSTQSATGLLYFNSALIYFGELAAQYLMIETGWPL